jgi:alpha-methylacyl-CoA racemase
MSLAIDEQLALGRDISPGHDVLSGRYACYAPYSAADGKWLAVGAIEAKFFTNLCNALGCPEVAPKQYDDDAQPAIRAAFGAAFGTRPRDEWIEVLSASDTCVAPILHVAELAPHPHFVARGAITEARHPSGSRFRQLAPLLAGMPRLPEGEAVELPDPSHTDTEHLLKEAGVDGETVARWVDEGVIA